jgi:hypothetical protein
VTEITRSPRNLLKPSKHDGPALRRVRAAAIGAAESARPGTCGQTGKEEIMSHKKAIVAVVVALSAIVLAGFVSVSLTAQEPISYRPNDRANHHPLHVNG